MRSLADLIDTNTIPNAVEIAAISSALAEPGHRLRNLDRQITVLETTLNRLLQEQEQLSKDRDAHAALLSPFRHLPPDILREIFYHCLPPHRNPVMSNAEAPMVLVQVCSEWREVGMTTPLLWAAIHIAIPADPTTYLYRTVCDNSVRIKAVIEWLSRSGILPLSLSVTLANRNLMGIHGVAEEYIDALLPFASRWRKISLTLYATVNGEGLDERCGETGYRCVLSKSQSGLFKAPRLHTVSVPQRCYCFLQLPVKWSQLTHLDLKDQYWSLYKLMSALVQCPGLQHVRLRLPSRPSMNTPESALPHVSLTRLISLSVIDSYRLNSSALFQNIHAPNLRHFVYQRHVHRSYSWRLKFNKAIVDFFSRVAETLEELQLHTASISDRDVMGYLYLLPGLKRLSLLCPDNGPLPGSCCDLSPRFDDYFIFGNKELARFTKSVVRVEKEEMFRGESPGTDTSTEYDDEPIPILFVSSERGREFEFDSESPQTPLCPKLEVFHCIGAFFTLPALLEFLQARSSPDPSSGLAPLRRAVVRFSQVEECKKVYKALKELNEETGMVVELSKQPEYRPFTPIKTFLPYEGLPEDDIPTGMTYYPHGHQSYFGF